MDANTLDKVPVNWNALDALVLDYAEAEQLLMDNEKSQNSFVIRCTIGYIRGLIEQGSIAEALELLQLQAPSVLQDQRLVFRLHKQKFIELLRSGGLNAHEEAIKCCRTVLGPCALTAYPEAYQEFKRLLLALIYDKDDVGSPVIEEWSEAKRIDLAATIASVLKAQLQAYDPLFSLTLRYLLSMHNSYCSRQGIASPIAELTNALLDKEKDPPATPHDCLLEAPKFEESDVQALANAVDLSRQGAVDSLRYAGGDLILAFKNELSRFRINTGLLDDLVQAYCIYRGLIDGSSRSVSSTCSQNVNVLPEAHDEQGSCAKSESEDASRISPIDEVSVEHKCCDGVASQHQPGTSRDVKLVVMDGEDVAMEDQADTLSEHSMVCGSARADSGTASESICSTSDCAALEQKQHAIWRKYKSNCPRKRWSGRRMLSSGGNRKRLHCEEHITVDHQAEEGSEANKFGIALEIKEMACQGMVDEVIKKVNRLNPHFFESNPRLLFQLKQMEFFKLVEAGHYTDAVSVARCDLGPLAAKHSDLLKALKETVLALARPQGEQLSKPVSPSMLGATLQVVLSASLGVAEPDLMRMIKVTLQTHSEWFKLQMCADPFGEILNINALRDTESVSVGSLCHNSVREASTVTSKLGPSSQCNSGDPSQQSESSRGATFDDRSILTVMEWLALSRGDAIQLLTQYGGSVESIFEHELV